MTRFSGFSGLQPWLDDADHMLVQARDYPQSLEAGLTPPADTPPIGLFPLFQAESVSAALYGADGDCLAETAAFRAADAARYVDAALVRAAAITHEPRLASIIVPTGAGPGHPAIIACAPLAQTAGWQVPDALAAAIAANPNALLVVTSLGSIGVPSLESACRAFGMAGLETRVTIATVHTGAIHETARQLGISYQTAREAIAGAMKRAVVNRLPALVSRLSAICFGVMPGDGDDGTLLANIWAITPRQAALGALVADGLSRAEAAAALGISESVAKKEIERLYQTLGVESAAALARVLAETNAMQWVIRATGGSMGFIESRREPLRFALRPDGTRIAWSDYGPASGQPVLVVHSSMTTRFVSRRLLHALHARGFRPIAIDRPGFGLSDPIAGLVAGAHDPFAAAVADVGIVARQARIARFDVVSRGAAHDVLALGWLRPDLVGRVVIVNPDPDSQSDARRHGPLGAVKEAYIRRPALVRLMARLLASQLTGSKPYRLVPRTLEGSPPDEAAIAEPDILEDYVRALRPFATGRIEGYVNEQTAHATMGRPPPLPDTHRWQLLVGAHDTLYDPDFVLAYWRETLPDADWTKVANAGRLMAMSQAGLVVNALAEMHVATDKM
jgi:pimeloyl-ACP methyl ester carboxylesterase/DNA-binding CsgD family transcriptional regulator